MTTGGPSGSEDDLLVAEYVLGVLPHEERIALERRLAREDGLRLRQQFWEARLEPLGQAYGAVQPPAELLGLLERRLFGDSPPRPGLWHSLAFWRGLAAALLVALVIGLSTMILLPRMTSAPGGGYVAELAGDAAGLRLAAFYDAQSGMLKLNRVAGKPGQGRDLELWLIAGNSPPVSLGVLPAQAMATLQLPEALAARLAPDAVLAVSDEPPGGSPTGQPTGAVLATGTLSAI